jgi:glycosyltransferase involved in cell wall biosynthesis
MKILFLYTELAAYVMSCFKALSQKGIEVHVVRWQVNKEAPFDFDVPDGVRLYDRSSLTGEELVSLVQEISPDKIICSGWVDKEYLKVCRFYRGKIPTVLTLDNHWIKSIKQQVLRLLAPVFIKLHFSHAWVPGKPQVEYACKLGFGEKICEGFYSADSNTFNKVYNEKKKCAEVPKRFIYIGRYIPAKGLDLLFKAFIELQDEWDSGWELWCLGTGELFDSRPIHPKIKHFGFIQPAQVRDYLIDTGVFVLPSLSEPWGVVVHECAIAGMPMIVSDTVGAATCFLEEGENGFCFESGNADALKTALRSMMTVPSDKLREMGEASHQLGIKHSPERWAEIVEKIG